jgi:hypothetical protein
MPRARALIVTRGHGADDVGLEVVVARAGQKLGNTTGPTMSGSRKSRRGMSSACGLRDGRAAAGGCGDIVDISAVMTDHVVEVVRVLVLPATVERESLESHERVGAVTAGASRPCGSFGKREAPASRNVQKLDRGVSGRFPVVEAEKPTQALPAYDRRSRLVEVGGRTMSWPARP